MPILSFSVNETIRSWIKKLIKKKVYKNQSNVIRDALTRLMDAEDITASLSEDSTRTVPKPFPSKYKTGLLTIVCGRDKPSLNRNLKRIERTFGANIKVKQMTNYEDFRTITYTFEGTLPDFQRFTTDMNSVEDIRNLRYLIVN
ncbi:MAG: hypothetical protein ACTSU5_19490 [Promethearchaeota archaeon]